MEMQNTANNGGLNGVEHKEDNMEGGSGKIGGWPEIGIGNMGLRVLALLLTLVAAIMLGVDRQTTIVAFTISPNIPALNIPVTAKSSYLSAFVYFVVANSIACGLAAISLVIVLASKGSGRGGSYLLIISIDLVTVALLFSGIGAAGAVGMVGYKGNSHVRWNKVCNVYGKFCHQVMGASALSLLGAIVFVLLVWLSVMKLQKRS